MHTLDHLRLESRLESICQQGCQQVRRIISALEAGVDVPETHGLNQRESSALLAELQQIMAVYGDVCRL
ncbi:hypothetical protein CKO09_04285 [Chromatium weissei]|nr:hypothetical protein [Chromatium weissei]